MMKVLILAAALALSANALPSDNVPEDTLLESFNAAKAKVQTMLAAGKDDSACRNLAETEKTTITTSFRTNQRMLDLLPDGAHCEEEGQAEVRSSKKAYGEAQNKMSDANRALTSAGDKHVELGTVKYKALMSKKCLVGTGHEGFQTAKRIYNSAAKVVEEAEGEVREAKKVYHDALEVAKKARAACLCKVKNGRDKAWRSVSAGVASANEALVKATHMLCVLGGTSYNKCKAPSAIKLNNKKLTQAASSATCSTDHCPQGYNQIGTKNSDNDVGGTCLGQKCGHTMDSCAALCKKTNTCVSFMFGPIAQHRHCKGICEVCDKPRPNNSWGTELYFCTAEVTEK